MVDKEQMVEVETSGFEWTPEERESFRVFNVESSFYNLGFNDIEIKAFMAQQPAVYERVLKEMHKVCITTKQIDTARNLHRLSGYRLERALKFLEPLGTVIIDFLKAHLKGDRRIKAC